MVKLLHVGGAVLLSLMLVLAAAQHNDHVDNHDHENEHAGHSHGHEHVEPVKRTRPVGTPINVASKDDAHLHSHSHSHSHSHAHSHSHSHGHGGNTPATSIFRYPESVLAAGNSLVTTLRKLGPWQASFAATAFISIAPVFILLLVPIDGNTHSSSPVLKTLVSFAVGGLLGDVFLHLLPHALMPHNHGPLQTHNDNGEHDDHSKGVWVGIYVLLGLITFFAVEKFVRLINGDDNAHGHSHATNGNDHGHSHATTSNNSPAATSAVTSLTVAGLLNLAADAAHNFTDGMAIAASFLVSPQMGLSTTIAVFFHEIPHEIGDYAILIQSGFSRRQAMLAQVGTAGGALLGTLVGLVTGNMADSVEWIIPFTAGGFIYVATVGVLPTLLEKPTWGQTVREIAAISLGVASMVLIALNE